MKASFTLCSIFLSSFFAGCIYGAEIKNDYPIKSVEESEVLGSWHSITLDAENIGKSFTGNANTLQFTTNGVNLKSFFKMYSHHSVYLDVTLK